MEAKLIKIGESQGIIIPSEAIDLLGLSDKIKMNIVGNRLVITPAGSKAREGWEEMIKKEVEENGQPGKLMSDSFEDEDNSDWKC